MTKHLHKLSLFKQTPKSLIDSIDLCYIHSTKRAGDIAIFVTDSKHVYAVGTSNKPGQLGVGDREPRLKPVQLVELTGLEVVYIQLTDFNAALLTACGQVFMCGDNSCGQIGDGTKKNVVTPKRVAKLADKKVVQMKLSVDHVLALTDTEELYAWGDNSNGQIGMGSTAPAEQTIPHKVKPLKGKKIVQLVSGYMFSLVLTQNDGLYSWGYNIFGQLGDGTDVDRYSPVQVKGLKNVNIVKIACGLVNSVALDNLGRVYVWGGNSAGQLGINVMVHKQLTPVQIKGDLQYDYVRDIACGINSTIAQTPSGIYVWGELNMPRHFYDTPTKLNFKEIKETMLCYFRRTFGLCKVKEVMIDSKYLDNLMKSLSGEKLVDVVFNWENRTNNVLGKRKREEEINEPNKKPNIEQSCSHSV